MECPICGQINTDEASVCLSCGQSLLFHIGGVSVDTEHAKDQTPMVIAGNIDFPLPPTGNPASLKPPSSQPPKPSQPPKAGEPLSSRFPKLSPLPKVEGETAATPAEDAISQTEDVDDAKPATAKPLFSPIASPSLDAPPLAASTRRPAHLIYAGFWYRLLAWLIDIVILGIAQSTLWIILLMVSATFAFRGGNPFSEPSWFFFLGAQGVVYLTLFVLTLLYFALSESSRWQGTLGKLAIGLKVTDADGSRISFLRALGRYAAHFVTNLTFGIGYVLNVFTARQQTLHDLIAGTLVVYKEVTPLDLVNNPSVPAPATQKVSVMVVWFMCALLVLSVALVAGSLTKTIPKHQTSGVAVRMHEAEKLGAEATAAVSDYQEIHGRFPPTLGAAGFHQTSPQVRRLWISADSGIIHLELGFYPLRSKTLDFVPEFDEDGDLIWRCRSSDIESQHLPEHCQ